MLIGTFFKVNIIYLRIIKIIVIVLNKEKISYKYKT